MEHPNARRHAHHPEITRDGFAYTVFHELGHHFGGYPFYQTLKLATEGQSDYFASQVCLRDWWANQTDENKKIEKTAPATIKAQCADAWSADNDRELCQRIALAGLSFMRFDAAVTHETMPDPGKTDPAQIKNTAQGHLEAQCRFDTVVRAAQCLKTGESKQIPGRELGENHNFPEAEKLSAGVTCTARGNDTRGLRPRCWSKSNL